ncbi:hypothetical protein L0F63_003923 [Massospora cicadina]|nr:hypothetical protein L0F63_003923 [Massospora cicadina]
MNAQLTGVHMPGQAPVKIMAFADDCVVGVSNNKDARALEALIQEYSRVSNMALNASKTEIILLGQFQNCWTPAISSQPSLSARPRPRPINSKHTAPLDQYAIWACGWRQADTRQQVVLANFMLLSKVWFGAHAIPFSPSFYKSLYALLQGWLWLGRPPPVRLEVMFGPQYHGGMGLLDFKAHAANILGTWIAAVTTPTLPPNTPPNTARSNFSRALGLNNPSNPHSLMKYLASHTSVTGRPSPQFTQEVQGLPIHDGAILIRPHVLSRVDYLDMMDIPYSIET